MSRGKVKGVGNLIYENIKRLCAEKNVTICSLEKSCGIANGTIGKWENKNSSPRVETLMKIANFFGVSLDELVNQRKMGVSE